MTYFYNIFTHSNVSLRIRNFGHRLLLHSRWTVKILPRFSSLHLFVNLIHLNWIVNVNFNVIWLNSWRSCHFMVFWSSLLIHHWDKVFHFWWLELIWEKFADVWIRWKIVLSDTSLRDSLTHDDGCFWSWRLICEVYGILIL